MSTLPPTTSCAVRRLLATMTLSIVAARIATIALALGLSTVAAPSLALTTSQTGGAAVLGDPLGEEGCETSPFAAPVRAAVAARRGGAAFAVAARRNRTRGVDLDDVAVDTDAWLDPCGQAFYLDPVREPAPGSTHEAPSAAGAPVQSAAYADTFSLSSRPGSPHTVYLDFTGGQVTGTAWNKSYGASIAVEPYSRDGTVDTRFSDAELLDIQQTWALVAADYAPFDVDVTTRWPGQDALTRSSDADTTYGTQVRITNGGVIFDRCTCGGAAYVNVFADTRQHAYTQPAFVFSRGTGQSGKTIGEAVSHEVGHNFGLSHDGAGASSYYTGSKPWAPIMGAGYYQPVTQWSRGEYSGATNTEDDVSIIARSAPRIADDHGGSAATATMVTGSGRTAGRITTRGDTDAFTFTGAGKTTVAVTGGAYSDLDVSLKVLDESGAVVATVNPAVSATGSSSATGLDASWSATLPPSGATRTVIVDGVGHGSLLGAGAYSDYASLGQYALDLTTSTPAGAADVLRTSATPLPPAVRTREYTARPVTAEGGRAPYTWSATGLPAGLRVASATGALTGSPTSAGTFPVSLRVVDADGRSVQTRLSLTVNELPALVLLTGAGALPVAEVGRGYRGTIRTRGAEGDLAWRRVRGIPPRGLRIVPEAAGRLAIVGVPRRSTTRTLVLAATDSAGRTVHRGFRIRVVEHD